MSSTDGNSSEQEVPEATPPTVTITMTRLEAKYLLDAIEHECCIVNYRTEQTFQLFDTVATALYGQPIKLTRPKEWTEKPVLPPNRIINEDGADVTNKKTLWTRFRDKCTSILLG